jgi:hypothetical protein
MRSNDLHVTIDHTPLLINQVHLDGLSFLVVALLPMPVPHSHLPKQGATAITIKGLRIPHHYYYAGHYQLEA